MSLDVTNITAQIARATLSNEQDAAGTPINKEVAEGEGSAESDKKPTEHAYDAYEEALKKFWEEWHNSRKKDYLALLMDQPGQYEDPRGVKNPRDDSVINPSKSARKI